MASREHLAHLRQGLAMATQVRRRLFSKRNADAAFGPPPAAPQPPARAAAPAASVAAVQAGAGADFGPPQLSDGAAAPAASVASEYAGPQTKERQRYSFQFLGYDSAAKQGVWTSDLEFLICGYPSILLASNALELTSMEKILSPLDASYGSKHVEIIVADI